MKSKAATQTITRTILAETVTHFNILPYIVLQEPAPAICLVRLVHLAMHTPQQEILLNLQAVFPFY
jgi:hypothetical protein